MALVGPKRLVLLNAGKYDFADVDLDEPLHLVGPNNVGKTSLIAALQFLYIDSQNHMHFARDLRETRKYYFPDLYSYILFECLTPAGFRVLGIHGRGPLHQYEFERFTFVGRLDLGDFLDAGSGATLTCRAWENVKLRLAHREYLPIDGKELRAALTGGSAKEGGVSLGLLPLAQRASYDRFTRVFTNLLRLSHVTQHELKELLVNIFEREFRQRELNLDGDYREQYEDVRRGWREVALLRDLTEQIDELLRTVDARKRLRLAHPARWQAIQDMASRARERSLSEEARIRSEIEEFKTRKQTLASQLGGLTGKMNALASERGGIETKLKDLADRRAELGDFEPRGGEARATAFERRIAALETRLASAAKRDLQELRRRRGERAAAAAKLERQLGAEKLAGDLLALFMERTDLEMAFSLLDSELLTLPTSPDPEHGISIQPALLGEQLRAFASSFDASGYVDDAATVGWKWLERPNVSDLVDRRRINSRLQDVRLEIEELDRDIDTAERQPSLEDEKGDLVRTLNALRAKLWQHGEVVKLGVHEPSWHDRIRAIEVEEAVLVHDQEALFSREGEIEVALSDGRSRLRELLTAREKLTDRLRRLAPPDPDWPPGDDREVPGDLDLLMDDYVRDSNELGRQQARIAELLSLIDRSTDGRYPSGSEAEAIRLLAEDRAAFPEREKALQQLWASLLTALRSGLTALNRDIETLRTRIDALNRQLTRHGVSDLEQIYLDVQDTSELRLVRSVADHEEAPLLADRKSAERALDRIGDLLKKRPRIGLMSLFDLHFVVTTPGGVGKRYPDLDKVESNGTTVTIKVLINLLLLRGLISERESGHVNIPFYLDEVASLDARNRRAVVALARELGFVPVLASPEPLEGADRVYFVSDTAGRITLDPKGSRIRISPADQ